MSGSPGRCALRHEKLREMLRTFPPGVAQGSFGEKKGSILLPDEETVAVQPVISISTSPGVTRSPLATCTAFTVPAIGACTSVSIFIASAISTG